MKCPICDGKLLIKETRRNFEDNETYRERKCVSCGKLVYTTEFEVKRNAEFDRVWKNHDRMKQRKK